MKLLFLNLTFTSLLLSTATVIAMFINNNIDEEMKALVKILEASESNNHAAVLEQI